MRTIIWFAYFWGYLVFLMPQLLRAEKRKKNGEEYLPDVKKAVFLWARRLLKLAGADITVIGLENIPKDEPVLFIGNHSGYFDIPLLLAYLNEVHPIVAKKELERLPLINRWMRLFDCLFIDRANPRQSVSVLSNAAELIKQGKSVSIFPEGTRAKTHEIGEFKAGAFKIAEKTKAVIIPLAISGTRNLMENNRYFIHPAKVTMQILPPIQTMGLEKSQIKQLPEQARELIVKAMG